MKFQTYGEIYMNITQRFYNHLATQYDKLFLDCACGIGIQAIGIAAMGYHVTAVIKQ